MSTVALTSDETLLALKIAFLVLLYLFIIVIVRTATKDIGGAPQESIVLGAADAAKLRAAHGLGPARFAVLAGRRLAVGRDRGEGSRRAAAPPTARGAWSFTCWRLRALPPSTHGRTASGSRISAPRTAPS